MHKCTTSSDYTGLPPRAEVGFQFTDFTVPEDVGLKRACVVLLSGGPVLSLSAFRVTSRDGTAESADTGKYQLPFRVHMQIKY